MSTYDLSVIIPARNEEWLRHTIEDVLANRRAATEIIVIADGEWPVEPLPDYPDVTLVHHSESIGQRAAINEGARMSQAKYIMKLDAHCRLGPGFDEILMADCAYEDTVVPRQYNMHAFNWKCLKCGIETYQGPKPTRCIVIVGSREERIPNPECNGTEFERITVWEPRWNKLLEAWRFDSELHYQQWGMFTANEAKCRREGVPYRPEAQGEIIEVMSCLGACWFLHRYRYWDLGGSDEEHGSWGQQGTEIACKSWLSGGRLLCNRRTYFAHLFRTQPGWQFPYTISHTQTEHAKQYSRDFWRNNRWPKAKYPLSWLVRKFWPVPGWEQSDLDALEQAQ
jgi:glycosyltransferase involved in cell wall biosynthesis